MSIAILNWFKDKVAPKPEMIIPCPEGLSYYNYQKVGAQWLASKKSALLADAPGTGKTITAIAAINADPKIRKILIICPATLKLNWRNELRTWLVDQERRIQIVTPMDCAEEDSDIVIINYDLLEKHRWSIDRFTWDLVICDEAHYVKNPQTKRYIALFGTNTKYPMPKIPKDRLWMLTGTPIVNRPVDLFGLLSQIDPTRWGNWFLFTERYCAPVRRRISRSKVIRDISGASNLDDLHKRMSRTIMLRRLREDVLSELPTKTRQIIALSPHRKELDYALKFSQRKLNKITELENKVTNAATDDEFYLAVTALEKHYETLREDMAVARRDIGMAKVPQAIEHIKLLLENEEKVVVFGWHHDVIDSLAKAFAGRCVVIDGRVASEKRQGLVDAFQNDPNIDVFIGNTQSAGMGITLTASHNVVFVETDFSPSNMFQAEDRVTRIGQKFPVLSQILLFDGTLDANIVKLMAWKQKIIDRVIDGKKGN